MKEIKLNCILPNYWVVVSIQVGFVEWLSQNLYFLFLLVALQLIIVFAIYLKLFASIIPEGTTYRFFRKGRFLRESSKGGIVLRIPFIDRIEIVYPDEPSSEDIANSLDYDV